MNITFQAIEDIKKGALVILDFETGHISLYRGDDPELQPKKEPNIIEKDDHSLEGLMI